MTTIRTKRFARLAYALAALTLSFVATAPARADDFPSDVKRTFQTDIPHFFQDDIPCAFGGQPTSGTKTSCKSATHKAKPAAQKHRAAPAKKPAVPAAKQPADAPTTTTPSAGQ
ncbi:MAG TPA: hypothetical protein VGL83_03140 [Stellaceae bacterium]|jgi:hypothetical protein